MIESRTLATQFQSEFSNGSIASLIDLPCAKGGQGAGFGPHELLEAALATCMTLTAHMQAAHHKMPLESAHCTVRIDRSNPAQATLQVHLDLHGPLTAEQKMEIREAVKNCQVSRTLSNPIRIAEV